MLLSPRKNGLTSLFEEVRVFKVTSRLYAQKITQLYSWGIICVMGRVWGGKQKFSVKPPTPILGQCQMPP